MNVEPEAAFVSAIKTLFPESGEIGSRGARRVLAAVSGGADSVFLLIMLRIHSREFGYELSVATVNHSMRSDEESAGDASFVEDLCRSLDPPVPCIRVDLERGEVARLAAERGRGQEEAARTLRYRALEDAADRMGAQWIMTGHNRNDQNETVLMRILQGSGGAALSGISARRGRFYRPLLDIDKRDITAWLTAHGHRWREDATNANTRYLRNRIRNVLAPVLDSVQAGWADGLAALREKNLVDEDFIRGFTLPEWEACDNGLSCDAESYHALHGALRLRLLQEGLNRLGVARRVPYRFLSRVLRERSGSGRRVCGSGLVFRAEGDKVFFGPDIVHITKSGYLVYVRACGSYRLPFGRVDVAAMGDGVSLDGRLGPFSLPLLLRARTGGDAVQTADGKSKTIKKLFNEWSVRDDERDLLPIVECGGIIRAVYGSALGYPDWLVRY